MEQNNTSTKPIVVFSVIALLAGVALGFLLGNQSGKQANIEVAKLQAQIEKAKKSFPQIPELRSLSGKVTRIDGNTITLETSFPDINPFETIPKERTVIISGTTKVVAYEQKSRAVLEKEMEDFMKNMRTATPDDRPTRPTPPTSYNEKAASASDIKEGMTITVLANENIKEKISFTASKVVVSISAPEAAVPPIVPLKAR